LYKNQGNRTRKKNLGVRKAWQDNCVNQLMKLWSVWTECVLASRNNEEESQDDISWWHCVSVSVQEWESEWDTKENRHEVRHILPTRSGQTRGSRWTPSVPTDTVTGCILEPSLRPICTCQGSSGDISVLHDHPCYNKTTHTAVRPPTLQQDHLQCNNTNTHVIMIVYCVVVRVHLLLCVQPMNECRLCTMWNYHTDTDEWM